MARHKDTNWNLPEKLENWTQVQAALLMDLRYELREIRGLLSVLRCQHFLRIPAKLDRIGRNTTKPKRKKP